MSVSEVDDVWVMEINVPRRGLQLTMTQTG